jgi:RNA polymerase sigma-70 factor, ECF subfamily
VRGPADIARLIDVQCPAGPDDMRLLPVRANGQHAFGLYMRSDDGRFRPFHLQVLTMRDAAVAHTVAFFDTSLFAYFGLPDTYPEPEPAH